MAHFTTTLALLATLSLASCAGAEPNGMISGPSLYSVDGTVVPPLDPNRQVSRQDCTRPLNLDGHGDLFCV